jgi:hypothetical protein
MNIEILKWALNVATVLCMSVAFISRVASMIGRPGTHDDFLILLLIVIVILKTLS